MSFFNREIYSNHPENKEKIINNYPVLLVTKLIGELNLFKYYFIEIHNSYRLIIN